jgi:hypothetical protein
VEERLKREQDEWRKEKELLLKEKENEKVRAEAELSALKNKLKVCGENCTKDHTNDGACLNCGYNLSKHNGHACKLIQGGQYYA